jgi:hypothetical protein
LNRFVLQIPTAYGGGSEGHKGREAAGAALGLLATLRAI